MCVDAIFEPHGACLARRAVEGLENDERRRKRVIGTDRWNRRR